MKQFIKKRKEVLAVACIFLVGMALRCLLFGHIPSGVNQDEAMGAVDALALAKYGTDRFGVYHPVHLQAWGYSQMSAGLSYLQAIFIKLFGFSVITIRLPLLISSAVSLLLFYFIGKKTEDRKLGILLLALCAVNPWHFMQSRWSMDCNLFPHFFMMGFFCLLCGVNSLPLLYLSMVFFGLTFYCYGIAIYSVPLFLLGCFIWLLATKKVTVLKTLSCAAVFLITALPEIIVMWINYRHLNTLTTGLFTFQYFSESVRKNDLLFMNFSFHDLFANLWSFAKTAFLQLPGAAYNAPPQFGPCYHISLFFIIIGLIHLFRTVFQKDKSEKKWPYFALLCYFFTCVFIGAVTRDVNVNRINIIFPLLIILTGLGIIQTVSFVKKLFSGRFHSEKIAAIGILLAYTALSVWFFRYYFFIFPDKVNNTAYYKDYLQSIREADSLEGYDIVFISGFTGEGADLNTTEILTNFICGHDAHYLQGITDVNNGRTLLPYRERYRYFYSWETDEEQLLSEIAPAKSIWLVHSGELDLMEGDFSVVKDLGNNFLLLTCK